ncbi:g3685 [Coccomyxa viridis]|uniref:G3685 protein n=1 Tax=Coccomyxa viridis TaxID=1274662 RepID=A0ABP1FNE5_9CHLO
MKYTSSIGVSFALFVLCCYGVRYKAEVGEVVLGALLLADFLIGVYVVVLDELVKEWRLVRTKPYQMELDDALALTDEDALAKDMSALRAGKAEGRSYYMEATAVAHPQTLHEVKVEGQWKKMVRDEHSHETTPVLKGALGEQPFGKR